MSTNTTDETSSASMLHGHAAYVAGAAKETIGNLSGSAPWQTAGQDDKAAAVDEMRAAKEASGSQTQNPTVGKVEEMVGKGVGCEGMVEEGGAAKAEAMGP
ncbi:hypothetical protein MMC26_007772 [Xylographa opegraphella]|nr:hypothetical protein [Xylographa opegraphella]